VSLPPIHEPVANKPTPDPCPEGNWPAGAAPLPGGPGEDSGSQGSAIKSYAQNLD